MLVVQRQLRYSLIRTWKVHSFPQTVNPDDVCPTIHVASLRPASDIGYCVSVDNDNDNDNDNILFDHNLQIEITIYNSSENQIINTLVWRLLLRQNNLSLA